MTHSVVCQCSECLRKKAEKLERIASYSLDTEVRKALKVRAEHYLKQAEQETRPE